MEDMARTNAIQYLLMVYLDAHGWARISEGQNDRRSRGIRRDPTLPAGANKRRGSVTSDPSTGSARR